jgi:hypothetical protein
MFFKKNNFMNIKKIVSYLVVFVFVLAVSGFIASRTEAAVSFPYGCSSAIGYSVMTGSPCNGTSVATLPIPGCASPIGYSVMNGAICSGASEAISFLGGCTSVYGYSTATGAPCNGTAVASVYYDTTSPGLPTTGANALSFGNMLLLLSLGLVTIGAAIYTLRRAKTV